MVGLVIAAVVFFFLLIGGTPIVNALYSVSDLLTVWYVIWAIVGLGVLLLLRVFIYPLSVRLFARVVPYLPPLPPNNNIAFLKSLLRLLFGYALEVTGAHTLHTYPVEGWVIPISLILIIVGIVIVGTVIKFKLKPT